MRSPGPLDTITRRAGAVMSDRDGRGVPSHYGSPAGELAVCVRMVGLADRSDLGKLAITGSPAGIGELVRKVAGGTVAATGVLFSAGAWWCAASPSEIIVLCERARRGTLLEVLCSQARRVPGIQVADSSESWAAIALVGPQTLPVLAELRALGAEGDPRSAAPFGRVSIADVDVHVLLQSDQRALVLVPAAHADTAWRAIEEVGRQFGLSCVGMNAVDRFSLLDGTSLRPPATMI